MIERHIEKIVLAVCVVLLVYAAFHWAASSPRTIEVITNRRGAKVTVGPENADVEIHKGARDIQNAMEQAKATPYAPSDDMAKLRRLQSEPFGALAQAVPVGQPGLSPKIGPTIGLDG